MSCQYFLMLFCLQTSACSSMSSEKYRFQVILCANFLFKLLQVFLGIPTYSNCNTFATFIGRQHPPPPCLLCSRGHSVCNWLSYRNNNAKNLDFAACSDCNNIMLSHHIMLVLLRWCVTFSFFHMFLNSSKGTILFFVKHFNCFFPLPYFTEGLIKSLFIGSIARCLFILDLQSSQANVLPT